MKHIALVTILLLPTFSSYATQWHCTVKNSFGIAQDGSQTVRPPDRDYRIGRSFVVDTKEQTVDGVFQFNNKSVKYYVDATNLNNYIFFHKSFNEPTPVTLVLNFNTEMAKYKI